MKCYLQDTQIKTMNQQLNFSQTYYKDLIEIGRKTITSHLCNTLTFISNIILQIKFVL